MSQNTGREIMRAYSSGIGDREEKMDSQGMND